MFKTEASNRKISKSFDRDGILRFLHTTYLLFLNTANHASPLLPYRETVAGHSFAPKAEDFSLQGWSVLAEAVPELMPMVYMRRLANT